MQTACCLSSKCLSPRARLLTDKPKERRASGSQTLLKSTILARGQSGAVQTSAGPQPAAPSFARCAQVCGHTQSAPLFDQKQRPCTHQSRALGSRWSLPTPVRLHGSPSPVTVFSLYFLLNSSSRFFFGFGKTHSFIGQVPHIIVRGSAKTSIKRANDCACLRNLLNHVSVHGQLSRLAHVSSGSATTGSTVSCALVTAF